MKTQFNFKKSKYRVKNFHPVYVKQGTVIFANFFKIAMPGTFLDFQNSSKKFEKRHFLILSRFFLKPVLVLTI
jgi:hypothetical protein